MLLPTTTAILILVIMMLQLIIIQIMPTMTVVRTIIRIGMRTIRVIAAKNKNTNNIILSRILILRW